MANKSVGNKAGARYRASFRTAGRIGKDPGQTIADRDCACHGSVSSTIATGRLRVCRGCLRTARAVQVPDPQILGGGATVENLTDRSHLRGRFSNRDQPGTGRGIEVPAESRARIWHCSPLTGGSGPLVRQI
jgi:hypothetical protein